MLRGIMGLVEKEGKFLFGIEAKEGKAKGKWRLLGGKLEEGENSTQAMIRESFEEAAIKVEVKYSLGEIKGDIGDIIVDIIVDMCYTKWIAGKLKPAPREFEKLEWFTLEEAKKLDKDMITTETLKLFEEGKCKEKGPN